MAEPAPGPSSPGSVILELGPGIGALVLRTPPELDGREIEVSPPGQAAGPRTHSRVRPRRTGGHTQYDDDTPAATVTIHGGQVTTTRWPGHPPP